MLVTDLVSNVTYTLSYDEQGNVYLDADLVGEFPDFDWDNPDNHTPADVWLEHNVEHYEEVEHLAPHVIMIGTLSDGYRIVGPFPTWEQAEAYADKLTLTHTTWIMPLDAPTLDKSRSNHA